MSHIVLASSSRYRQQLLEKLGLTFVAASPDIDEQPHTGESPFSIAQRLSETKARALKERFPNHLIIGSDQVAELNGIPIGKPGNHQRACQQLQAASGNTLHFHTGVALFNSATATMQYASSCYAVKFRQLSQDQIDSYLRKEAPYDCAGSFKSEGLGIALFEHIRGDDPNSLIGLPLIQLTHLLLNEGIDVLR